jgi:hypothetical protein
MQTPPRSSSNSFCISRVLSSSRTGSDGRTPPAGLDASNGRLAGSAISGLHLDKARVRSTYSVVCYTKESWTLRLSHAYVLRRGESECATAYLYVRACDTIRTYGEPGQRAADDDPQSYRSVPTTEYNHSYGHRGVFLTLPRIQLDGASVLLCEPRVPLSQCIMDPSRQLPPSLRVIIGAILMVNMYKTAAWGERKFQY